MKISIGTQNKGKILSIKNGIEKYEKFKTAEILGIEVESQVSAQPIGLEETIQGAKNRAKNAYEKEKTDLAISLESGIFKVPHTKSEYMDTTACAIYDGKNFHIGLSSCFEYPKEMIQKIIKEKKEISDIAIEMGFSDDPAFREGKGMIGILTKGVIDRTTYSEQAFHMAMIHLLNKDHY